MRRGDMTDVGRGRGRLFAHQRRPFQLKTSCFRPWPGSFRLIEFMASNTPILSEAFQRLYCNALLFERISALHPVNFTRVLPFQAHDPVADNPDLLTAEGAHLANPNNATRLGVVEAFGQCNLLTASD